MSEVPLYSPATPRATRRRGQSAPPPPAGTTCPNVDSLIKVNTLPIADSRMKVDLSNVDDHIKVNLSNLETCLSLFVGTNVM